MNTEWHELFRIWVSAILLALSLFWTVYWTLRQSKRTAAKEEQDRLAGEIAALRQEIKTDETSDQQNFATLSSRLSKVEDNITHLPTKEQLHNLELAMSEIKGGMRELSASISPLSRQMDRVLNFMDQTKVS